MGSTAVKEERTEAARAVATEKDLADKIQHISERIPAAQQHVAELKAERERLVIPARVDRDVAAQKRIRAIDEELLALEHDLADDQAAVRDLSNRLESATNARIGREWEQRRAELRKLLTGRREGKAISEVLALAGNLHDALRKLKEEDQSLFEILTRFAPRWHRDWKELPRASALLVRFVAMDLSGVLPIDTREVMPQFLKNCDAKESDRTIIDRVLAQLDDLELAM